MQFRDSRRRNESDLVYRYIIYSGDFLSGILSQWQESLNNHRRCVQYWDVTFPSSLSDINGRFRNRIGLSWILYNCCWISHLIMSDEGEIFTLNLDVMNEKKNHLTQTHFNSKINGQTFHEDGKFFFNKCGCWLEKRRRYERQKRKTTLY